MHPKNKTPPPSPRAPLTTDQKDFLFMHLLRCPELFAQARQLLSPTRMRVMEDVPYLVLWQAALTTAERNQGLLPLPARARLQLEVEAKRLADASPQDVTQEHLVNLFGDNAAGIKGLLDFIYETPEEALDIGCARVFLQDYLSERTIHAEIREFATRSAGTTSLQAFLEQVQSQHVKIANLGQSPSVDPFAADLVFTPTEVFPTKTFLDEFMAGGQALGEVYVLLGPSGSGKSTLGLEIAWRGAAYQHELKDEDEKYRPGHWYFFTYESPVQPDFIVRLYASSAEINETESLLKMRSVSDLSTKTKKNYKEYELKRFAASFAAGNEVPGEQERLDTMRKLLRAEDNSSMLHLVDFSGTIPGAGAGGVDELAAFLEAESLAGRTPVGVVIDYAGIAIDRYAAATGVEEGGVWNLYRRYVNEVRIKVAARFNCCAWVVHQLHGSVAKRKPGAHLHHSDAAGCRNFVDNAWFAFSIGNADSQTHVLQVECTKQRRAAKRLPMPVYLDGAVRRLVRADGEYKIDPVTGRFMPIGFVERVVTPGTTVRDADDGVCPPAHYHDPAV